MLPCWSPPPLSIHWVSCYLAVAGSRGPEKSRLEPNGAENHCEMLCGIIIQLQSRQRLHCSIHLIVTFPVGLPPHCNLSAGNSSDFVKFTIYVMKKLDCTSTGESIMRRVCFSNFLFQHKCAHLGSKPGKPKWEKPGSHYITKSLPAILRRKSHTVVPLVVLSVVVILLSEYWRRACRVCTLNLIELDVVVVAN